MKAISLYQPWGWLIQTGYKEWETHHWDTFHRGPIAIHAAKRWTPNERTEFGRFLWMFPELRDRLPTPLPASPLPLGVMLCICELTRIVRTEEVRARLSKKELAFGNYTNNRYAWRLELIEVFDTPIPAVGHQGIFDWERP